ncbi:MAG: hypothetical protein JO029_13865 [Candidatus Eremiobacteraeota bacterium]|nr:hypothetical protein [Candidatus Eremiobacteraeota bacterium]MBV8582872.1 hypothetical protein [Candidatus Eremiobacteraeota bacterium]MBV8655477.1 hypothetical protein [Candidatus Eremiobacteraeota bacterium]
MSAMRIALVLLLTLAACSSQSPEERAQSQELAALAPLKQRYSDVVMGFDFKPHDTLVVSLDLQNYNGMNDDDQDKMKSAILAAWKSAWEQAHPGQHATIHTQILDFIGRTIARQDASV